MAPRTHLWETVLAGKWSNLGDATLQDALEAAYSSGSDGYQFKARGYTYDVDFGRMKQINVTTKRERNLRRVPDPRAPSVATATAASTSGIHLPSTKLYHGPSATRVYTGPSTTAGSLPVAAPAAAAAARSSGPTKATFAGSVVLHPGPAPSPVVAPAPVSKTTAPPAPSPVVAPAPVSKTTAPPTKAKSAAPTTAKSLISVATASSGTKSATTATSWRTAKAPATTAWKTAVAAPLPVAPPVAPAPPPKPVKMPLPHQGKVKTFFKEKGYGFIQLDDNQEVFFHVSAVSELLDGSIRANDTVEVSVSKSGKPRALQVRVKRRGSIFKQMCSNKCCRDRGDRHFEDRCPLKRKSGDGDDASVSTACS